MGIDVGDFDNDGMQTIVIGNFYKEPNWLYKQTGPEMFVDRSDTSGIGMPSRTVLKFAVVAVDFDHDGLLDILTADGHVHPEWEYFNKLDRFSRERFREPMQLFRNIGNGNFLEVGHLMQGSVAG